MKDAYKKFKIAINNARNFCVIYNYLNTQSGGTLPFDAGDLLRSQLVMTVSALDFFIHELVRIGMLEIYMGQRKKPPAFSRFMISLGGVMEGL